MWKFSSPCQTKHFGGELFTCGFTHFAMSDGFYITLLFYVMKAYMFHNATLWLKWVQDNIIKSFPFHPSSVEFLVKDFLSSYDTLRCKNIKSHKKQMHHPKEMCCHHCDKKKLIKNDLLYKKNSKPSIELKNDNRTEIFCWIWIFNSFFCQRWQ